MLSMLRTATIAVVLTVMCLVTAICPAASHRSRVVLVVAPSISVRDIARDDLANLRRLFDTGSSGLMNVRTGRPGQLVEEITTSGLEPGCVSLGAGAMAVAGSEARWAFNVSERVHDATAAPIYKSLTGKSPGDSSVVHTAIARITKANSEASYKAKPGALGSALHKAGLVTALIGNADIPGELHRECGAIVMDEHGLIDLGDVGSDGLNVRHPAAPFGIRANIPAILNRLDMALQKADFTVLVFGDTFRADAVANLCTDQQAGALRVQASRNLDLLVCEIVRRLDLRRDTLILLSPNPRSFSEIECERLAPIVVAGPGFDRGVLTSPSTRRVGVVTLTDVAPTVLKALGVDPSPRMVGRPMVCVPSDDAANYLLKLNMIASLHAQRLVVMRGSSVVASLIVVLTSFIILLSASAGLRRTAAWAVVTITALPLAMLLLPLIYGGVLLGSVLVLITLTAVLVFVGVVVFRSPGRAFAWICAATVIGLILDLVTGSHLIGSSIAGYPITEGARYYGIGNELMGTLLGSALMAAGLGLDSWRAKRGRDIAAAVVCGIIFVAIGAPTLGANVGGALAALSAGVVTLLMRRGWRPTLRGIVGLLLAVGAVIAAMLALDLLRGGDGESHAGRLVRMATSGDALGVLILFQRKIALNLMLVSTSLWSRLLGLCVVAVPVFVWFGRKRFIGRFIGSELRAASVGCAVGVVAAFVFNDSGVVAAATCIFVLWAALAVRIIELQTTKRPELP